MGGWRPPQHIEHGKACRAQFISRTEDGSTFPDRKYTQGSPVVGGTAPPTETQRMRSRGATPYFNPSTSASHTGNMAGRGVLYQPHRGVVVPCPLRQPPFLLSLAPTVARRGLREAPHDPNLGSRPPVIPKSPVKGERRCTGRGGGAYKHWGERGHREARYSLGRPDTPLLSATPPWSPPCAIVAPPRWPLRGGVCVKMLRPSRCS